MTVDVCSCHYYMPRWDSLFHSAARPWCCRWVYDQRARVTQQPQLIGLISKTHHLPPQLLLLRFEPDHFFPELRNEITHLVFLALVFFLGRYGFLSQSVSFTKSTTGIRTSRPILATATSWIFPSRKRMLTTGSSFPS